MSMAYTIERRLAESKKIDGWYDLRFQHGSEKHRTWLWIIANIEKLEKIEQEARLYVTCSKKDPNALAEALDAFNPIMEPKPEDA